MFLHGVGFGVLPYLKLVSDLMDACPGHPVIVIEVFIWVCDSRVGIADNSVAHLVGKGEGGEAKWG